MSGVHDLHVWTLTSGKVCLSAHVVADDTQLTLRSLTALIRERFGIEHITLQIEDDSFTGCSGCRYGVPAPDAG